MQSDFPFTRIVYINNILAFAVDDNSLLRILQLRQVNTSFNEAITSSGNYSSGAWSRIASIIASGLPLFFSTDFFAKDSASISDASEISPVDRQTLRIFGAACGESSSSKKHKERICSYPSLLNWIIVARVMQSASLSDARAILTNCLRHIASNNYRPRSVDTEEFVGLFFRSDLVDDLRQQAQQPAQTATPAQINAVGRMKDALSQALYYACRSACLPLVKAIFKAVEGTTLLSVNAPCGGDTINWPPLHAAVSINDNNNSNSPSLDLNSRLELVKYLVEELGADVNAENNGDQGYSASVLMQAVWSLQGESQIERRDDGSPVLQYLLSLPQLNKAAGHGSTRNNVLTSCVQRRLYGPARFLIRNGIKDVVSPENETALQLLLNLGCSNSPERTELVALLLQHKASDPNLVCGRFAPPLATAIWGCSDDPSVVGLLLDAGAKTQFDPTVVGNSIIHHELSSAVEVARYRGFANVEGFLRSRETANK